MSTFIFSKKNPYFLSNTIDKVGFLNQEAFNNYDKDLFDEGTIIQGSPSSWISWNQFTFKLNYTDEYWNLIQKINYLKFQLKDTSEWGYYWITEFSKDNKLITITAKLDSLTTFWLKIKFKTNASALVDRLHAYRWLEKEAILKDNKYYLSPNFNEDSFLWQSDSQLAIDNKIKEEIISLENNISDETNLEYNPFIKGQFIYFIMKYNDKESETTVNYKPFGNNQNATAINPMPFWIIPIRNPHLDSMTPNDEFKRIYKILLASPYLHSIEYSIIPWGLMVRQLDPNNPNYDLQDNQIVLLKDWKAIYEEDLPTIDGITNSTDIYALRADTINNWINYGGGQEFKDILLNKDKINKLGYLKNKNNFDILNEPKLFMFPFFELNFIRAKRKILSIMNERLLSLSKFEEDINFFIKLIFTPYQISTYHIVNNGLYNTSLIDYKYSINTANANTLVSLSSSFQTFLVSYLSNFYTGLYSAKFNRVTGDIASVATTVGATAGGALAGAGYGASIGEAGGPIGAAGGAVIGALLGLLIGTVSSTSTIQNNNIKVQQEKNKLTDLARQPDSINSNADFDTYTDIQILQKQNTDNSYFISSIRIKSLPDYNKLQVALWFHKFGYPINKNLVIDNWDKLLIRESWNYIQIEQFSDVIDLQSIDIPWQAVEEIVELFNKGVRIWLYQNNFNTIVNNYNLPNWEIGLTWASPTGKIIFKNTDGQFIIQGGKIEMSEFTLENTDGQLDFIVTPNEVTNE